MEKIYSFRYNLLKIILPVFAVLTIYSIWNIYSVHQLPLYVNETNTLCEYYFNGTFDYTAKLRENVLYNKTTLKPGEGILYTAVIDHINLTFSYTFDIKPRPRNLSIETKIAAKLESPDRWIRLLTEMETEKLLFLKENQEFNMILNITNIQKIVDQIDFEAGIRSLSYNLTILPNINVIGEILDNEIKDTFNSELIISFISGGKMGDYINIGNLQKLSSNKLTQESERYLVAVELQRKNSYIYTAIWFSIFAATTVLYLKYKPAAPKVSRTREEEILDKYKELLYETSDKPPETENTISIDTIDDLVKTAEILLRPILHTVDEKKHIFYIIDDDTKYQYITIE